MKHIGAPLDRADGPLKVSGKAAYTGDLSVPRMAHAVIVASTVAAGRIALIDDEGARRAPGVIAVLTHANAMKLPQHGRAAVKPPHGRVLSLLQDDRVHYNNEPIAVVVAETLEQAVAAASMVRVSYRTEPARLDFGKEQAHAYSPGKIMESPADTRRGDPEAGLQQAALRETLVYATPMQHHNPMEPHATLASWEGERLTLHDSTQYVAGVRQAMAKTFGIPIEQVRVRCDFVGGAFGGKGSAWSHVALAAMAARHVARPVRLVMARPQLFGPVGGRPCTEQKIGIGADRDGQLTSLTHESVSNTSVIEDWTESSALVTRMLYACPNLATAHRLVKLNVGTPTFQRAPGEATGMFALECAMDEMAERAGLDPVAFRLRNHADTDPDRNRPFSSKSLRQCYQVGAERFGWARRDPRIQAMRDGHWQIGMGMATATRPAKRMPCRARVRLTPDGWAVAQSSTADLGTGTYTVMAQIAADVLGYPVSRVRFELGDTDQPEAPISAGSMTVESVGTAVQAACEQARRRLVDLAVADMNSPLHGAKPDDVSIQDGWLRLASNPQRKEPAAAVIARQGGQPLEAQGDSKPGQADQQYSMYAFGAVFVEARVDRDLGVVRVPRVVGAYGVGTVINEKTARSQIIGGIVWGLSMALYEASVLDPHTGRFVNANLAEYHVPVNADIGEIDVVFVPEHDEHVNALGAKGLGEISMTGVPAAVANAVYHATGRRIRELPITLDRFV